MKIPLRISAAIRELGGSDGFWKSDTQDTLESAYKRIYELYGRVPVTAGNEDQFLSIIESIYWAVKSEYGD